MNKLIKRITLCVAMIMAVCAVSVMTSTEAKAYTTITLKQTAQTTTSATVSWTPVPGAAGYIVYRYADDQKIYQTTGTTYTITVGVPAAGLRIYVVAYDSYGYKNGQTASYFWVMTAPELGKTTLDKWPAGTTTPTFIFDTSSCDNTPTGIEVEVKNAKKKLIKVLDVSPSTYGNTLSGLSAIKNSSFIMRARPYITVNGVKIYGNWTSAQEYVAQPKVSGTSKRNYYYRTRTINLKWPKIKGAKSYSVYRSTKKDGKYKKVGTTTSTKFSQSVNYNSSYYYYVKAENVNVGGKKKSTTLGKIHNLAVSY